MPTREQIESIANTSIDLYEEIKAVGTPEMQAFMRLLLYQIGRDLAMQHCKLHEVIQGPWVENSE